MTRRTTKPTEESAGDKATVTSPQAQESLPDRVTRLEGKRDGERVAFAIIAPAFLTVIAILGISAIVTVINSRVETGTERGLATVVDRLSPKIETAVAAAEAASRHANSSAATADAVQLEVLASLREVNSVATQVGQAVGDWTVILSSHAELNDAILGHQRAIKAGYGSRIYKIGDYYAVTFGRFGSKEDAENALIAVRADISPSAYPLNLSLSCPVQRFFADSGFYGCFFAGEVSATATPAQ